MKSRFAASVAIVQRVGYEDIAQQLATEADRYQSDTYKIAVVGEFKTGKSTLINRVFLKSNTLFTDVMEATAIPTEIFYSPEKRLEVIPYIAKKDKKISPFDEKQTSDVEVIQQEGAPVLIENPAAEDIKTHTSASSSELRTELAKKTSRVKLGWPAVNLFGLTVFDTPGINSLNEAVVATTYRIIPEADVVVFVTTAKQLSTVELEFMSGHVFKKGITRAMVVVTYDPNAGMISDRDRDALLKTIRRQMEDIGRADVPVDLINIREDETARAERMRAGIRERIESEVQKQAQTKDPRQSVDQVIGGLLGEHAYEGKGQPSDEDADDSSIGIFERKLIQFIRNNVKPARMEKAAKILSHQLQLAKVRCAAEIGTMKKDREQRRKLYDDLKKRESEIRNQYETLSMELAGELKKIQEHFTINVGFGLNRVLDGYVEGFDACESMGELQDRLNRAEAIIKKDIEAVFIQSSRKASEDIEQIASRFRTKSQVLLNPWQFEISRDLVIDGGVLANVPPFAVIALDFSVFILFGPLRPVGRLIIRLLANEIPFVQKMLPANMAAGLLKSRIKKSLKTQFDQVSTELDGKIEENFKELYHRFLTEWQAYADTQLNTVRKGVESALNAPFDENRKKMLSETIDDIDNLLAELSSA